MKTILGILLIFVMVIEGSAQGFDIRVLREVNVNRQKSLDPLMHGLSNTEAYIGTGTPLAICAYALLSKQQSVLQKGINMSAALAIVSIETYGIKRIVNRPRPSVTYPDLQALESEVHYSFPSGHSSNAFCTATSLSLQYQHWYVAVPAFLWAGSVAYSRMHLGMHYPSDVLGGMMLGAGTAWLCYKGNQWLGHPFEKKPAPVLP